MEVKAPGGYEVELDRSLPDDYEKELIGTRWTPYCKYVLESFDEDDLAGITISLSPYQLPLLMCFTFS